MILNESWSKLRIAFTISIPVLLMSLFNPLPSRAAIIGPSEVGYTQVYGLNIPNGNPGSGWNSNNIPYLLDIANTIPDGSFDRIAYHLELQQGTGPVEFVWVSVDTFTDNASEIGVPSRGPNGSNTVFQQNLTNMNVFSNKPGIITGNGLATGNIEFWSFNYGRINVAGVPNATNNLYDSGDQSVGRNNYGSMQIHNHAANADQTLFALNRWGGGFTGNFDLGIGNQIGGNPDWTFSQSAAQYSVKTLEVWVKEQTQTVPEPLTNLGSFTALGLAVLLKKKKELKTNSG